MSRLAWPLRLVALVGPILVLFGQVLALPPVQPREEVGFVALLGLGVAVALALVVFLGPALATVLRHADLLVPLGLYVTVDYLVNTLLALPALAAVAAPWGAVQWSGLAFTLSLATVGQIMLAVFYGGWVTRLILQAVQQGRTDLAGALARPWRWFGRVFVAETLGWGVLMGMMIPAVLIAQAAMPLGLLLIGLGSLLWNLATAALLPVVVSGRHSLGAALAKGIRASWAGKWPWGLVVVVQMLLLGWITFLSVSLTTSTGTGNVTTKNTTNWSVNGFWTGGYEENCRWYTKVTEIYETQPLPPVATLLGLVFGVLAIAVKVRIVRGLRLEPVLAPQVEFFDSELSAEPTPVVSPGGCLVKFIVVAVVLVGLLVALAYRRPLADALLLRQLHGAAKRGENLEPFVQQLKQREDPLALADRLSADPDPRIRLEMIDLLIGNATPARKVERPNGVYSESWKGVGMGQEALQRLLADPDPAVRQKALRAVSGLKDAERFSQPLLHALAADDLTARVIVAESLAHWDAAECIKTFADPVQPREVRLAAVRGAEQYGWDEVSRRKERFGEALKKVLDDPDPELRRAALGAVRYSGQEAPGLWFGVVEGKRPEDRALALDNWIDALTNEVTFGGESYPLLEETEEMLFIAWDHLYGNRDPQAADHLALLGHILCAAAQLNTRELERTPPANLQQALFERQRGGGPAAAAFVVELHRLQQILRALTAVRGSCAEPRTGTAHFSAWLPGDPLPAAGAPPPTRMMKDYLLAQAREPLAWCRRHADGYASPFLRVNGFRFGGEDGGRAGETRTLGQVLKDLHLDTDEALAAYLKEAGRQ